MMMMMMMTTTTTTTTTQTVLRQEVRKTTLVAWLDTLDTRSLHPKCLLTMDFKLSDPHTE